MVDYLEELSSREQQLLKRHHFDRDTFERLRDRYAGGDWTPEDNRLDTTVELPQSDDIEGLPARDSDEGQRLMQLGKEALESGQVGALVLNGGMATRFGSVVKGCVEVFDDHSFLGIKLADAARWDAPVLLMNSFAGPWLNTSVVRPLTKHTSSAIRRW